MRRLSRWDGLATLMVVAIAVPYIGYLVNGSMPFVHDPRGMAGTGLMLGAAAFIALYQAASMTRFEVGLAGASLVMGVVALALAETFAADVLLAVFMATILVVWAFELGEHAGRIPPPRWHRLSPR